MAPNTARNLTTFLAHVAAMAVFLRYGRIALERIPVPISGLEAIVVFYVLAGIAGSFAFRGSARRRAGLVLLAGTTYGVLAEVFSPDPRHAGAQVFVAIAFAVLAALASLAASLIRRNVDGDRAHDHA